MLVMGILNVTPDSFADGGLHFDTGAAIASGIQMSLDGADIIDVGGESTRPGAERVSAQEEEARVIPVITALAEKVSLSASTQCVRLLREKQLQRALRLSMMSAGVQLTPRCFLPRPILVAHTF